MYPWSVDSGSEVRVGNAKRLGWSENVKELQRHAEDFGLGLELMGRHR